MRTRTRSRSWRSSQRSPAPAGLSRSFPRTGADRRWSQWPLRRTVRGRRRRRSPLCTEPFARPARSSLSGRGERWKVRDHPALNLSVRPDAPTRDRGAVLRDCERRVESPPLQAPDAQPDEVVLDLEHTLGGCPDERIAIGRAPDSHHDIPVIRCGKRARAREDPAAGQLAEELWTRLLGPSVRLLAVVARTPADDHRSVA